MTNTQTPPAHDADIQERIDGFNKELQPLLGKYELGLGAIPFINPNGTIGANPVILSVRPAPKVEGETTEPAPEEDRVEPSHEKIEGDE